MEQDPEDDMGELRVEDSEDESNKMEEGEPCTPPVVTSVLSESTALRTPRSAQRAVNRGGETPRSEKKSLRRTRLTEAAVSGVRTQGAAKDSEGLPSEPTKASPKEETTPPRTRSSGPVEEVEVSKSSPAKGDQSSSHRTRSSGPVDEVDVPPKSSPAKEQSSPHRTRSSGPAEEVEVKSAHKTLGADVDKEVETSRRTRGASISKEVEAPEKTPRRTRGGSLAKETETREAPSRRARGASVSKEEVHEEPLRRARGGSVAKDSEVQEGTPRRTRGSSIVKDAEVEEGTPRRAIASSIAKDDEVEEGTPRRTRGSSVAKDAEVEKGTSRRTRGSSIAKDAEVEEGTPRRTRGPSVAKDAEVEEGTSDRTRGSSVAKDGEVQEGMPRRTRRGSVAKDGEVVESSTRRTRGSGGEVQEGVPRRTRASSVLKEVPEEEELPPISASPAASVSKEVEERSSTPSRLTRNSGVLKEDEAEAVTPRRTRSSASLTEEKTSTPRRTRSSSVLKDNELSPTQETPEQVGVESSDGAEAKTRGRGRSASVAKEVESPARRETRSSEAPRQTRSSADLKEDLRETSSPLPPARQTRSASVLSERDEACSSRPTDKSPKNKADDQETSSAAGKRGRRSKRGKPDLESSFESKDGDTESNYSRRSEPANSPDSIASRVRSRASVSSVDSGRKRKSNDSSLILHEKLARISDSEESTGGAYLTGNPLKRRRSDVGAGEEEAKSIYSDVTERLHSESESEHGDRGSTAKQIVDATSRDRIEAAIQEYSSTRRLTRKQQALLSRSMEICAQPERFPTTSTSAVPVSDVEEEEEEDRGDLASQSSVRSSVRLRRAKAAGRNRSPTSTATTEVLSGNEQSNTPTRKSKRTSGSQVGSPSSVVSGGKIHCPLGI